MTRFAALIGQSHRPSFLRPLAHRPGIRFESARYDYRELLAIKARIQTALAADRLVAAIGIDDARNLIHVEVPPANLETANDIIASAGIAPDAVNISAHEPAHETSVDTDHVQTVYTPLIGGWQILATGGGQCTLGLVVQYGSSNTPGFITAGHCLSGVDSIYMFDSHADTVSTNTIGTVVETANTYSCSPNICITADVGLVQVRSGVKSWFGGVAEPISWAQGPYCAPIVGGGQQCYSATGYYSLNYGDPLVYDPVQDSASANQPPYQIDQDQSTTLAVGTWVQKMGRTTGGTTGKITIADFDTPRSSDGALVLHTVKVAAGDYFGDSGSPVFDADGTIVQGEFGARFDGIAWGADSLVTYNGHSVYAYFLYSPLSQIRLALANSIKTH